MFSLRDNRGFSIVELGLALGILSIITVAMIKFIASVKEDANQASERYNAYVFERGVKVSFNEIIDAFETVCFPNNDNVPNLMWGWLNGNCSGTSPLPVFVSKHYIRYNVNFSSLPNPQGLVNKIAESFKPYCQIDTTDNATYLQLFCPNLSNLQYDAGGGLINAYHTAGSPLDPDNAPVVVLTIDRWSAIANTYMGNKTYRFSLSDVFEDRKKYSIQKMSQLAEAIRTAGQNFTAREVANPPPSGLNSIDDVVIPYFWKVFADNYTLAQNTLCNSNCSNYTNNIIWRVGVIGRQALLMRRAVNNLMGGDVKYYTDGFGNAVSIFPFISQCPFIGNYDTCNITSPTKPRSDYWQNANVRPPYVSAIYNWFGRGKGNNVPLHDRLPFTH